MPKHTVIGDTTADLSIFAKSFDIHAIPWTPSAGPNDTVYVSLGEVGVNNAIRTLLASEHIICQIKAGPWSTKELKQLTDNVIYLFALHGIKKNISNFPFDSFVLEKNHLYKSALVQDLASLNSIQKICNHTRDNFRGLVNQRRSLAKQVWVAGCSFAKGIGLESDAANYGSLVSSALQSSATNIACSGSSIDFSADQILRSPIKPGDLVIWGLTGSHRFTWFEKDQECVVTARSIDESDRSRSQKNLLYSMLNDESRVYLSQRHIEQVHDFCRAIKCDLVMIYHDELDLPVNSQKMKYFLRQISVFIDINDIMGARHRTDLIKGKPWLDKGSDNRHPGPDTHKAWSEILIDLIRNKGIVDQ